MAAFKIAVIVGSNRRESINRKLAQAIVKLAGEELAFHFVSGFAQERDRLGRSASWSKLVERQASGHYGNIGNHLGRKGLKSGVLLEEEVLQ